MSDPRFPVACPRCNAQPGEPCRSFVGGNVTMTHIPRRKAARKLGLECSWGSSERQNKSPLPNAALFDAENAEEG